MTPPDQSQAAPTLTRRALALLGTAGFLVLAPGFFVVLVPYWISRWRFQPLLLGFTAFRMLGVLLIAVALPVLLESFARFALQGRGTPAPVFHTQHLIVKGFYRYVRNPMYVAVVSRCSARAFSSATCIWSSTGFSRGWSHSCSS